MTSTENSTAVVTAELNESAKSVKVRVRAYYAQKKARKSYSPCVRCGGTVNPGEPYWWANRRAGDPGDSDYAYLVWCMRHKPSEQELAIIPAARKPATAPESVPEPAPEPAPEPEVQAATVAVSEPSSAAAEPAGKKPPRARKPRAKASA